MPRCIFCRLPEIPRPDDCDCFVPCVEKPCHQCVFKNIRCACGHGTEYHAMQLKKRACVRCQCKDYDPPTREICDCPVDGTAENLYDGDCYHDRVNRERGYD